MGKRKTPAPGLTAEALQHAAQTIARRQLQAEREKRSRRGFAVMDPARVREIANKGGAATATSPNRHRFTTEELRQGQRRSTALWRAKRNRQQEAQE